MWESNSLLIVFFRIQAGMDGRKRTWGMSKENRENVHLNSFDKYHISFHLMIFQTAFIWMGILVFQIPFLIPFQCIPWSSFRFVLSSHIGLTDRNRNIKYLYKMRKSVLPTSKYQKINHFTIIRIFLFV